MRIAVTGASGYVGSRIADHLEQKGHDVLRLSRRPCPGNWLPYSLDSEPTELPLGTLDGLVHAAHDFQAKSWEETTNTNINPSISLLRCAKEAGVRRIIYISSMSSFDGCRSRYGRAKRIVEKSAIDIDSLVVRPGLVWGQGAGGVMGTLEKTVCRLPLVPYLTGSEPLIQHLVHEEDLCEAIENLIRNGPPGTITSLANPLPLSLLEILRTIALREGLRRLFFPIPWRILMIALQAGERLGIALPFRSDSLIGLVQGNPSKELHFAPGPFRQFS